VIFHEPKTPIFDLNLSFDGRTVFFSARRPGVEGGWHIYEIGVDGQGLRQITRGPGRDISPALLPDGRIAFVSDRADTWVQCQGQKASLLYTCNRDGSGVRRLSANIDSDHAPQVMNDGRLLFTRWDYGIEKNVFARHALWTMNPDGTGLKLFFGNTIEDPAGFWEARPVPGRPEVICAFGPHHQHHAGMLGAVWDRRGPEAPRGAGFRFITDEIPCYCDTTFEAGYQDAFPLNERLFLASYGGDGGRKNRLYLVDDRGNRKCLYEAAENLSCYAPLPTRPRPVPPVIAPQGDQPEWAYRDPEEMNSRPDDGSMGTLLVQDVYRGLEPHVPRGEAKYLAVLEQVQKSRCMAGGEAWGHTPIIGRGTVHVRRLLGLVPIEADGSAHFRVPAQRSVSLNLLDAEGRLLMRMGSDMHLMPGERQSCIGCHENRTGAVAPPARTAAPLAAGRPPVTPEPPAWGTHGLIDYQRVVQPVWDRHCLPCHGGATPDGGIDLSGDRTRFFCVSYDNLVDRDLVDFHQPFAGDHDENSPLTLGSMVSPLRRYLEATNHTGRIVPFEDRLRVYQWIDANVPYYATYDYRQVPDAGGRMTVRGIGARDSWEADGNRNQEGWFNGVLRPVFDRRCFACHRREIVNQGLWGWGGGPMTRKLEVSSDLWTDRGTAAHMFGERYPATARVGPEFRINLTHPERSSLLQAPLAKGAGGWGLCTNTDGSAVFGSCGDPDYRRLLAAVEIGRARLYHFPRVDMTDAEVDSVRPHLPPVAEMARQEQAMVEAVAGLGIGFEGGLAPLATLPAGAPNLARGARASSPDGVPLQGKAPGVCEQAAVDGDPATFWDDADGAPVYRLRLDFDGDITAGAMRLTGWAQHDFAPRSFSIVVDGKTIGTVRDASYRGNAFQFRLPRTTFRSIELVITAAHGGSPAIRELELYDLPGL
jgi:hypothetical protein